MKFLQFSRQRYQFLLAPEERVALVQLLQNYPLIPAGYHRPSVAGDPDQPSTTGEVLREALEFQREENRDALKQLLASPGRFKRDENGYRLNLKRAEIEWLLQVINDIRVGCWLALGQPDEGSMPEFEVTEKNAPMVFALETCGHLQMLLIRAIQAGDQSGVED